MVECLQKRRQFCITMISIEGKGIKDMRTTIGKPTRHRKTKHNYKVTKIFLPIKLYCSEIKLCASLHGRHLLAKLI